RLYQRYLYRIHATGSVFCFYPVCTSRETGKCSGSLPGAVENSISRAVPVCARYANRSGGSVFTRDIGFVNHRKSSPFYPDGITGYAIADGSCTNIIGKRSNGSSYG